MDHFPEIAEQLRQGFETRNQARDRALAQARQLTRFAAHAIRALHRSEFDLAAENIAEAAGMVAALKADLAAMPDLFYAGIPRTRSKNTPKPAPPRR
jgi:predicted translin family RNA/ssDNA-binding protein